MIDLSSVKELPQWRNGRRTRLKIQRGRPRAGSSPACGTLGRGVLCRRNVYREFFLCTQMSQGTMSAELTDIQHGEQRRQPSLLDYKNRKNITNFIHHQFGQLSKDKITAFYFIKSKEIRNPLRYFLDRLKKQKKRKKNTYIVEKDSQSMALQYCDFGGKLEALRLLSIHQDFLPFLNGKKRGVFSPQHGRIAPRSVRLDAPRCRSLRASAFRRAEQRAFDSLWRPLQGIFGLF